MPMVLKIHPAIGFARLGNSEEFYIGPTTPGVPPRPDGGFRDQTPAHGRKAQAAAFWIFAHDTANPDVEPRLISVGDSLGGKTVDHIEWTVHLANKKAFWFDFDGMTGSDQITNPPDFGYQPGSLRNATITDPALRRQQLIIDFGPRTIVAPGGAARFDAATAASYPVRGPAAGTLANLVGAVDIDSLGTLRGQGDGGLLVVPAPGVSGSIGGVATVEFANNDGWFDNTSDGPVRAALVFDDGSQQEVDLPAWVVVTPPDEAPEVNSVVSLYDALVDVSVRHFGTRLDVFSGPPPTDVNERTSSAPPFNSSYRPSYLDDVYPLLSRPGMYAWVQQRVVGHHLWDFDALATFPFTPTAGTPLPSAIFGRLRRPENGSTPSPTLMPQLWGDEGTSTWLTLTPTQYHILRQWSTGSFDNSTWTGIPPAAAPDPLPRAAHLDRAALEACVGGGFFPGIELGWIVREPKLYVTPFEFRFKHPAAGAGGPLGLGSGAIADALYPGDATKRMACPWQADYRECRTQWWPAQRPDEVVTNAATLARKPWERDVTSRDEMVVTWHRLGVVADDGSGTLVERDRDPTLPTP